LFAQSDAGLFG
jgi:hypothetical protein